ncbi:L-aspartate oxidase [Naumannella halotolerans]|uniref:L-aspartate oxidase n=1 Tax=Naumannella halotolerans TaxID=993414 RepID=A0A4R7J4R0_9ACTN|nr:L-aspartate oxidase [Naumannella halotolerans]TDT31333.1 L-aspartate oxidase [Naumannella halotolerans]
MTGADERPVIIVGGGAAALSTAISLIGAGQPVMIIGKDGVGDGSTALAQGGLAAVLDPADSAEAHQLDTQTAGAGLCDPDAVRELVQAAPGAITRLATLGARFDTDRHGDWALGLEGGHSARRVVHAGGDASGAMVAATLGSAIRSAAAEGRAELVRAMVSGLLLGADGEVCGVQTVDEDGTVRQLRARAVVLATGGPGRAWPLTTNPPTATGDGLALALRAGAVARDLEFVQFHPTALDVPGPQTVLVSEAVRGEGAVLVDETGSALMVERHRLGDLAPRDVVAAAIHEHQLTGGRVWLDATMIDDFASHFPTVDRFCRAAGIVPETDPIPVRPAEHYHCGGVLADLSGRTTVRGLYAVGEVASTGVQGANRLASNSLTEALIAGERAGALLARSAGEPTEPVRSTAGDGLDRSALPALRSVVGRGIGVLRDRTGLLDALAALDGLDVPGDGTRADIETANLRLVARAIGTAALNRTESRGCHRRSDHRRTSEQWQRHQELIMTAGGDFVPFGRSAQVAA